jgi:alkylresorcinol/alkylpyrone synthase
MYFFIIPGPLLKEAYMSAQSAPVIHSATQTLPENYASQEELTAYLKKLWATKYFNMERLEEVHRNVKVGSRYLAVPLSEIDKLDTFAKRNDAYIRCATDLGEKAIREALYQADLTPKDIDAIFFVTVTGLATPSIDARLVNRLGMRADVKRTPIWGLGCVAGAAGIARASDYLRAYPDSTVVLLSVELCALTYQREDLSVANIISSGLFGDGASAVILRGGSVSRGTGPRVVASRSFFYHDTERVMGWDIVDSGFKVVLSPKVPEMVKSHFGGNVDEFLGAQGLDRSKIKHWLLHTGGPKVLEAFISTLGIPSNALDRTWKSLEQVGNLSSSSVLFVLSDMMKSGEAKPGDYALLAAMGPAFCAEMVLLQW